MFIRIARPSWRTARQQNRVSDAVRSQVQLRTSFSTLPEDEPWDESWREPAPFPHYNGWDHEMEADFQRRLNPNTWKSTEPIPNKRDGICDSVRQHVVTHALSSNDVIVNNAHPFYYFRADA